MEGCSFINFWSCFSSKSTSAFANFQLLKDGTFCFWANLDSIAFRFSTNWFLSSTLFIVYDSSASLTILASESRVEDSVFALEMACCSLSYASYCNGTTLLVGAKTKFAFHTGVASNGSILYFGVSAASISSESLADVFFVLFPFLRLKSLAMSLLSCCWARTLYSAVSPFKFSLLLLVSLFTSLFKDACILSLLSSLFKNVMIAWMLWICLSTTAIPYF